jgi:AraC-like DNA-binding protein
MKGQRSRRPAPGYSTVSTSVRQPEDIFGAGGSVDVVEPVMEQRVGSAAEQLGRFVHRYRSYSYEGFPVGVSHAVPSRHLTVMISLGDPITVLGLQAESFRAFAAGLQTGPSKVADHGVGRGVVVLDQFLLNGLYEAADPLSTVSAAWDHLVVSASTAQVGVLADCVGLSRRHLSGRFGAEYGLSPKQAGRVFRFERAANLLMGPRCPSLADTAASCGFFDQAHLTREWQALAG